MGRSFRHRRNGGVPLAGGVAPITRRDVPVAGELAEAVVWFPACAGFTFFEREQWHVWFFEAFVWQQPIGN